MSQQPTDANALPKKIGVVAVICRENKLLVIQRSQWVRAPGKFCFPGGAMEPGETESETLVREMQEELGVLVEPVKRLHMSQASWRVDLRWWEAILPDSESIIPNPREVASCHWMTVPQIGKYGQEVLESNRHFLTAWQAGEFNVQGLIRRTT
jgi:8-oxo-dGTP diphosphatase